MSLSPKDRSALVRHRMEDARQALDDSSMLLDHGSLRGAANRTYYAMFYAVSALALARGVAFKTHVGLIGYFQREFVANGVFAREHGRALQKAFDDRSEADYEDLLDFDDGQIGMRLRESRRFVEAIATHLGVEEGDKPDME